jgi:hypothetical protein
MAGILARSAGAACPSCDGSAGTNEKARAIGPGFADSKSLALAYQRPAAGSVSAGFGTRISALKRAFSKS